MRKLALKSLTLIMLLLSLGFFLKDSTKSLLASNQSGESHTSSPAVIVTLQEGVPLRVISTSVISAEPGNFRLQVVVQNQGLKPIRAYAITSEAASDKQQSASTNFLNLRQRANIWEPTVMRAIEVSDSQNEIIVRVRLTIDFVEFMDGTTWGPDAQHSSDILAGQREGARVEKQRLHLLLKSKGPKAIQEDVEASGLGQAEALVRGKHSEFWLNGFRSGVSSVRRNLKQVSSSGNVEKMVIELSKPFDTSEEN